jgi:putative oxidoreductase
MSDIKDGSSKLASILIAPIANLAARIYVALVFFQSGMSKVENWGKTTQMFQEEWIIPYLTPNISALLATAGELVLPIMLMIGFFTRFAAMGLLCIAVVIEFVIFGGNAENVQHYYWMLIFALIVGYGGDKLSLDNFFKKRNRSPFE